MGLDDLSLHIPGTELSMRVHAASFVDPALLDSAAILVGPARPGTSRPVITFDATTLAARFGARWPAIERMLSSIEPATITPELARIVRAGELPAECAPILAASEAALVDGDPRATLGLVLVYVHARIAALAA
ncbi:hypothetical protein L6R52_21115 [Myxococcota bacterium]|nr:hypothetical protein [Myxococcota bacterium]